MIYRTMVFGHQNCSRGYRVLIGSPEGVPGTPGKDMGLIGPREGRTSPQGSGAPPYRPKLEEKERREGRRKGEDSASHFPSLPLSFLPPMILGHHKDPLQASPKVFVELA